jgi:hypothetical protein
VGPYRLRGLDTGLVIAAVILTLSTAYIHYWVGGTLLLLNAMGYVTLAVAAVGAVVLYRRALPLVLVGLAVYAAVTIVGWLIMGPYFDVAYLAKGIEIVLIITIGAFVVRNREWTHAAIGWGLSIPRTLLGMTGRTKPAAEAVSGQE